MATRFFRESQITSKPGAPGRYPISKGTWRRWIRGSVAPEPIKLSPGVSVWSEEVLDAFDAKMTAMSAAATPATAPSALTPRRNPVAPTTRPDAKRPGRPRKFPAVQEAV